MKEIKTILILCATLAVSAVSKGQSTLVDRVVAVVGDNIILQSDIESQYQQMLNNAQGTALPPDQKCIIFDNLLLDKLFLSQAQIDSVTATPEEIESELDRRIKYFISGFGSKEKLEEFYGKTIIELKDDFKDDIEKQLISDKMKNKAFSGLKISPAEVKDFFERIPKDSIPYFNSELELGQIVMFPKVSEKEKEIARKKMEAIRKEIVEGGADFSIKAMVNTDDEGSKMDGGQLGWVERGEMVPEFEAVIFRLKEGEVSEVFETQYGYHIAIVDEIRGDKRKARHILIKAKVLPSDLALISDKMDSVLHQLRVDSLGWRDAVRQYSDDEQSKAIGGMMTNQKTGNTFFEKADIEGTLIFNLDRMKVGEFSDVLTYNSIDKTGESRKGYRIIWLKSESKPHVASLDKDYSKIQVAAKAEKQQKALENWLKLHKSKNYIRIDAMRDCPQMQKWLSN